VCAVKKFNKELKSPHRTRKKGTQKSAGGKRRSESGGSKGESKGGLEAGPSLRTKKKANAGTGRSIVFFLNNQPRSAGEQKGRKGALILQFFGGETTCQLALGEIVEGGWTLKAVPADTVHEHTKNLDE